MAPTASHKMSKGEFIALIAMMFSVVAFSIDAMLPAMPAIETDLSAHGRAHLLLTTFMGGLAVGTLFAGPISDAIGRHKAMFWGVALYIVGGVVAWLAQTIELVLIGRLIQGLGAAGPRVVSTAIVRDLYSGREMAQIVSFAMALFALVPTVAPLLGAVLDNLFGWRSIMLAFVVFMLMCYAWLLLRLDESLPAEKRRPFRISLIWAASKEIAAHRTVRLATLTQGVSLALIFCMIAQVQPIYADVFGRAGSFPYWFGGIALFSAVGTSLANAALVMRFGMRRLVALGIAGQVVVAGLALLYTQLLPGYGFATFVIWQFMVIWMAGLCIGNLNAMAMEPMGHIAGFTASISGFVATIIAAVAATIVGALFDGTVIPLITSSLVIGLAGVVLVLQIPRGEDA